MPKRFIIRKYVMAKTASEAIQNERKHAVDDVWVDEEWLKSNKDEGSSKLVGFKPKKSK